MECLSFVRDSTNNTINALLIFFIRNNSYGLDGYRSRVSRDHITLTTAPYLTRWHESARVQITVISRESRVWNGRICNEQFIDSRSVPRIESFLDWNRGVIGELETRERCFSFALTDTFGNLRQSYELLDTRDHFRSWREGPTRFCENRRK